MEGWCLLHISKMPVAKCNNLHNRLLVLLKGMILSSQFSNARWALSFGRYKEININKKRANLGSLEAVAFSRPSAGVPARNPCGAQVSLEPVSAASPFIGVVTFLWLNIGLSHGKENSTPEAPSAGKSSFTERASWQQEKSWPANRSSLGEIK